MTEETFIIGEICLAFYLKNFRDYSDGIELYYVKIIELIPGDEYCTCDIFLGEEWTGKNHKIGRYTDVCQADLKKIN